MDFARQRNTTNAWLPEQDERLLDMAAEGLPTAVIAATLGRTAAATQTRLRLLRQGGAQVASRTTGPARSPGTATAVAELVAMRNKLRVELAAIEQAIADKRVQLRAELDAIEE
jgi:hypothetical protein